MEKQVSVAASESGAPSAQVSDPPPAYSPPAPTTVVVQQPTAVVGPNPQPMTCPYCRSNIVTALRPQAGLFTYIMAGVTCLVACPCFWIPFVVPACQDTVHVCPACSSVVGKRVIM